MDGERRKSRKQDEKICAIVVTYNRKELLLECLESLKNQSEYLNEIVIIDNASTDGTSEVLKEKSYIDEIPANCKNGKCEINSTLPIARERTLKIHYLRFKENTGGAGGFHEGIKRAYADGCDWFWLMDDDTIPEKDSLKLLKEKYLLLEKKGEKIGFAASKVLWIDGSPHMMNIPGISPLSGNRPFNLYDEEGVLIVERASFVSLLLRKEVVEKVGLPIKEFFIWGDDVEYTLRITRSGFTGVYVGESKVLHKTKTNYSAMDIRDWRFFYNVRNNLWIRKMHDRKKYPFFLIRSLVEVLLLPPVIWFTGMRAIGESLIKTPKPEFPEVSKEP